MGPKQKYSSLLLVVFGMLLSLVNLQSQVTFEANTNAKEVLLSGYFEVSFTLNNANGTDFKPPRFNDFNVLAGPSSSTSMQIINGQVTRKTGFSYTLQPKREGVFNIGAASIKVNGKQLKTLPVSVKVLKGSNNGTAITDEERAYVVIEPVKSVAYPGEQILIDYKLYTSVSIDGYDIREEPDYKGFYVQELRRFNAKSQQEVVNGRQVTTKILRRLALFPQQTGELVIPAARIQLDIVMENGRSGFFFNRRIKPVFITTEPVIINVKDFVQPIPDNFTGAVGTYKFQASVNRKQATTDDAISITMMAAGDGDIKRVQIPTLSLSDSFEIYPPKVIEENITENKGRLVGRKIIEYLVLPKYPGNYNITPSFSYFNPISEAFETMEAGPYSLTVKQGTDQHISQRRTTSPLVANDDIRFIKQETTFDERGKYLINTPAYMVAVCLPFVAFIGLFFLRRSNKYNEEIDASALKVQQANQVALKRLSEAKTYLDKGASRSFYNEISKASLGYVCDKIAIPLSELSKNNVKEKLESMKVSTVSIEQFMQIFKTCEMALFAGMDNDKDMQKTYEQTAAVIGKIEEELSH